MERLDLKKELVDSVCSIYKTLSRCNQILPKSIKNRIARSIGVDLKAGLKQINKKVPVYVELPKYNEVGSGQYVYDFGDKNSTEPPEIITTPVPLEISPNSIQHKK